MDKEAFLKVLNDVKEITDSDLEDLLESSKLYPYCQNIHILIAKKYHDLKHGLAPAKLHKAAIYSPDRLFLKRIMEDDPSIKRIPRASASTLTAEQTFIVQTPEEPETELLKETIHKEPDEISQQAEDFGSDESLESSEYFEPSEEVLASNQETEPQISFADSVIAPATAEEEPVSLQEEIIAPQEDPATEKEDIRAELERNIKAYKDRQQQEHHTTGVQNPVLPEVESESSETTSTEVSMHPEEKAEKIIDKTIDSEQDKQAIEDQVDIIKEQEVISKQTEQQQLIENFIKLNPSLSRFDLKFDEDQKQLEDLSIPKLTIGEHLISENLAVILHKQGKVQKAVNIYEKLILKFPEKKAYFASCIEKIKNP